MPDIGLGLAGAVEIFCLEVRRWKLNVLSYFLSTINH